MTKEEEIRANAAVNVMQQAFEVAGNLAIAARVEAEMLKERVAELTLENADLKEKLSAALSKPAKAKK